MEHTNRKRPPHANAVDNRHDQRTTPRGEKILDDVLSADDFAALMREDFYSSRWSAFLCSYPSTSSSSSLAGAARERRHIPAQ